MNEGIKEITPLENMKIKVRFYGENGPIFSLYINGFGGMKL